MIGDCVFDRDKTILYAIVLFEGARDHFFELEPPAILDVDPGFCNCKPYGEHVGSIGVYQFTFEPALRITPRFFVGNLLSLDLRYDFRTFGRRGLLKLRALCNRFALSIKIEDRKVFLCPLIQSAASNCHYLPSADDFDVYDFSEEGDYAVFFPSRDPNFDALCARRFCANYATTSSEKPIERRQWAATKLTEIMMMNF
jgi:hypothetical protein